ncbi:Protein phosphatase 1 regulatory subunit 14B [Acipenser ruthenus]|uniref:Protein phosphatase 1 regulatory subunit 14B n=1 Tax=Acipenser ruthenus TaxID=7906 RepID=A0A662YT26_ACIRT|nr:Protein phosphatase 1 regulatory subunit 14B [Acipenser ruthenus]
MSASAAETSTQLPPPPARVFFQAAPTGGRAGTGPATKDDSVQKKNGKLTVKYDRKELRKRLILEEWIIEQLSELYDCETNTWNFNEGQKSHTIIAELFQPNGRLWADASNKIKLRQHFEMVAD